MQDMVTTTANKKPLTVLSKYEKYYSNTIALLDGSRKGLKPEAVFDFIAVSAFPALFIEKILHKTIKTFTTYKNENSVLDPVISEKLLKLFSLYDKGITVFGDAEEFNNWMSEPAFGLGGQVPVDLLETITGIDLITEELTRIEYGDLA